MWFVASDNQDHMPLARQPVHFQHFIRKRQTKIMSQVHLHHNNKENKEKGKKKNDFSDSNNEVL